MPACCGVVNCGNRSNRDRKAFFRLPAILTRGGEKKIELSSRRREKWLLAIKRSDLTETKLKYFRICEDHFVTGKPASIEDVNHPDWVPSKKLGHGKDKSEASYSRYARAKARKISPANAPSDSSASVSALPNQDEEDGAIDVIEDNIVNGTSTQTDSKSTASVSSQTDLTIIDLANLQLAYEETKNKVNEVSGRLQKISLSETDFMADDVKTRYYSGLISFKVLMIVFGIISSDIKVTATSSLTKFQQFLLTLMHLRLNLDFTDLSYRFGISKATASRVFHTCLSLMYEHLDCFLVWPNRSDLQLRMPTAFLEAFGRKVTIIIDCFEIFTQKPPNVLAAAQTYSHYKHHNTVKYLIGITPQGSVSYISSGYGGRASDKFVVQNCGILENLLPGDLILADRGFDISGEVSLYCAEIKVPAFTKGKKQLSPFDVEKTRELAHVRIHVERVIGALRQKYKILHNTMPISLVKKSTVNNEHSVLDMIVTVCCCLINISPSVVKFD